MDNNNSAAQPQQQPATATPPSTATTTPTIGGGLSKTTSSPTALYIREPIPATAQHGTPSLGQIGKQTSVNFRLSQLSDSGAESCTEVDDQSRLIRSPSSRSHKFIIIPAGSPAAAAAAAARSPSPSTAKPFRSAISAASLGGMRRQFSTNSQASFHLQDSASNSPKFPLKATASAHMPSGPLEWAASSPEAVSRQSLRWSQPTGAYGLPPRAAVTFTLDGEEPPMDASNTAAPPFNGNARNLTMIDDSPTAAEPPSPTPPAISSINAASTSFAATPTAATPATEARQSPPSLDGEAAHIGAEYAAMSAAQAAAFNNNNHLQLPLQTVGSGRDLSSYLYHDHVANQIYSDVTSVRSLASIGIGSTDGKKIVIRRVPHTPDELFTFINPPATMSSGSTHQPLSPPGIDDDDDDSFMDMSDDANLKPRQQHWGSKMQFVLACVGYSVGLGNVWRFPYMCYKSGGGVFLVPYCIILFICSIPLLFMELSVGQYTGRGPIGALGQLCPLFKGAGLASVVVSFLMSTYFSVIIGYSIYYFFTAFKPEMPWSVCENRWNTKDCWVPQRLGSNLTSPSSSRTPSEEFFENKVLQISPGIEYPGLMRWELFACLICAWLMVYFATWKSIKSSAKVRYFTATFPFILIIILMGRAVTLEGADEGLRYFFRPNWEELKNANVWINAASQNFNSLGITFGSMISFASYNKYNNNILRDTVAVSVVNILTSLLVGVFAFATLGNLALEQNTNVKDVIGDGPGLIFVVYPQAMSKMPYAQLWAVMFFFMLLCLGLNSQFAIVEVVVTSIQDGFPNWIKRHLGYHEIVVLFVCVVSFLFGLPNLIQGGIYFFQLMDHYAASVSIMFLAFCQMVGIAWFYGTGRLSKNIKQMTGKAPSFYLKSCWVLLGPCLLFAIWVLSLVNYKEPTYHNGKYKYPEWAYGIGWMFASLSLVCIPGYAIVNLWRSTGNTFWERLRNTLRPNIYECRICGEHHCEHDYPEQEQFMLAQEMSGIYKPVIMEGNMPRHPVHLHRQQATEEEHAHITTER